jgi:hypothetical protein
MSAQLCLGEGTCRGVSRKRAGHCCLQTGGFIGEKDLVKGGGPFHCDLSIVHCQGQSRNWALCLGKQTWAWKQDISVTNQ